MLLSDRIEKIIEEMIHLNDGSIELKRNELAQIVGCVPSQITYVISSRFTTNRGYITESKRGGGGSIKITRIDIHDNSYLNSLFGNIGRTLDEYKTRAIIDDLLKNNIISSSEAKIICVTFGSSAFRKLDISLRDKIRAEILRDTLLILINKKQKRGDFKDDV